MKVQVVVHLTRHSKVEGSNPAPADGTGKEIWQKDGKIKIKTVSKAKPFGIEIQSKKNIEKIELYHSWPGQKSSREPLTTLSSKILLNNFTTQFFLVGKYAYLM
jgi:hypothetical protein